MEGDMIEPGNPWIFAAIGIVFFICALLFGKQRQAQQEFFDEIGATARTRRRVNLFWLIALLAAFFAPFVLLSGVLGGR